MESSINCLPNEILLRIMSYMCVYDRINCKSVCIRWEHLATKSLSDEKSFYFGHHMRICSESRHEPTDDKRLTYYYEKIGKQLDESILIKQILKMTPNLKSLHLYLRNEKTIDVIKKYCEDIECLTLISFNDRVMLNAVSMIIKFGKTLKHLKLCDESRFIARNGLEVVMANILSQCNQLEIFHLFRIQLNAKSCSMISDSIKEISTQIGSNSINALIKSKTFENLENLIIRESIINFERMRIICVSFVNIKKLYIECYSDCDNFTVFSLIARMTQLLHLDISFIPKLYKQCIPIDEQLIKIFNGCRNLARISFSNCTNAKISDKSLIQMSICCKNMKHINFSRFGDMSTITTEGIEALHALPKLEHLFMDALYYGENTKTLIKFKLLIKKLIETNHLLSFICLMNYQMIRNTKN